MGVQSLNNMSEFLPEGYTPPASQSLYMRLEPGDNKFRILGSALVGYEYWDVNKKPHRSPTPFVGVPQDARLTNEGLFKPKHFWSMVVYNYKDQKVQILEITQGSIQKGISAYLKDEDWGPDPKMYDLKITKTGEDLNTEYSVRAGNKKPFEGKLDKDVGKINLNALFTGGDPFSTEVNPGSLQVDDLPFQEPSSDVIG